MGGNVQAGEPPEGGLTPDELDRRFKAQQAENERRRQIAMNERQGSLEYSVMPVRDEAGERQLEEWGVQNLFSRIKPKNSSHAETDEPGYEQPYNPMADIVYVPMSVEQRKNQRQSLQDILEVFARMGVPEDEIPPTLLPPDVRPSF